MRIIINKNPCESVEFTQIYYTDLKFECCFWCCNEGHTDLVPIYRKISLIYHGITNVNICSLCFIKYTTRPTNPKIIKHSSKFIPNKNAPIFIPTKDVHTQTNITYTVDKPLIAQKKIILTPPKQLITQKKKKHMRFKSPRSKCSIFHKLSPNVTIVK